MLVKRSGHADSEGTLDKGPAGSPTYRGEITFSYDISKKYQYVFHFSSATIYWTVEGETTVSVKWFNGIPIGCALPGEKPSSVSLSMDLLNSILLDLFR